MRKLLQTAKRNQSKHVIFPALKRVRPVYTDEFPAYRFVTQEYEHKVINHLEKYVDGNIHTNGIENFWSLLKRGLSGTYVAVEPFHLFPLCR